MAAVYGPVAAAPQKELPDRAAVEVSVRPKCGPPRVQDRAVEVILRGTVEEAVLTSLHPRAAVHMALQRLEDEGGDLACCINAACLALVDSGVPMRHLFAGVTVAIMQDARVVVDPSSKNRGGKPTATITFVFESTNLDVAVMHMNGKCSEKKFQECLGVAKDSSKAVFNFYRESIRKKFSKELASVPMH